MKGTARAAWNANGIRVEGEFNMSNIDLSKYMSALSRDFSATGQLTSNGTFVLQGTALDNLFAEPKVDATFNIERGSLNNVDLVRAVQNPAREGMRGGKTVFTTLAGTLAASGKSFAYRQLQLASGPLQANGNVDVNASGDLSGRINAELGSKTIVVGRGTLTVTGNTKTPVLRP